MMPKKYLVAVERNSFFAVKGGRHLRFTEHAPVHFGADKKHFECNCTVNADARPSGKPDQVQQEFFVEEDGASFRLAQRWLTFGDFGGDDHSYFIFGGEESSVRIEVKPIVRDVDLPTSAALRKRAPDWPGLRHLDSFLGHLYVGNQVDIGRLFNGHSPSRIVKLDECSADAVWAHWCSGGSESVALLPKSAESQMWCCVCEQAQMIDRAIAPYVADTTSSVQVLQAHLATDSVLLDVIRGVRRTLAAVVRNVKSTEMFVACEAVRREAEEAMLERSRRERTNR